MADKTTAKNKIAELVNRFDKQYVSYKSPDYNETQTRRDFIDPFFKALGWDIDNENDNAEAYREVIQEDKLKIEGGTKAPDYSFRLSGGKRLFFVEAKKPGVDVKDDIHPAYQIRRYGWSAKHPISIITDFEEFSIYDCTVKPLINDKPSAARIKYLTFREYQKEFDFIWDTFSKEHVLKGSFDKFIKGDTHKKGTSSVDKEFLESLDRWRTHLAVNISWNNKDLDEDEINFAVQQIIDRLIFLRIAEDRQVEPYGNLKHALSHGNFYTNLFEQFRRADEKYNSGLFDFKKDQISQNLTIENKVLKTIIDELYYPECPYEFSVIPVEILGSAYEQFLGKVIRITPAHHAKIEEKPEVRKAGGVYYTPQYIVDYIVKNTVGKLIDRKAPKEISNIKIVDPACGSGSFLIGAFQYLLDYHKVYYSYKSRPSKSKKDNLLTPDGNLTTAEKKRILLNNIYGVDIDNNAVEVTKLSLLLKCLEGETEASINQQLKLFNERVLPTLDDNIKSGNSLIDTDFYDNQLDFGEEKKIKPFSWKNSFPEIFNQGGFDVVIGNPPYVKIQTLQEHNPKEMFLYFKSHYEAAISGNYDIYVLFIEKGYQLLNKNGILGFIQPHKFFQSEFGKGIRNFLSTQKAVKEVVSFGSEQVFYGVTTYTCLLFLNKNLNKSIDYYHVAKPLIWAKDKKQADYISCKHPSIGCKWNFKSLDKEAVIEKITLSSQTLGEITRKIFVGLQTSADKIYVLETRKEKSKTIIAYSKSLDEEIEIEKDLVKPFLMGKDVKRYEPLIPRNHVIFPYYLSKGSARLMNLEFIKNNFPLGWNYILRNKKELESRENGKMKGENYFAYIYPKNLAEFEAIKICTPEIAIKPQLTIDTKGIFYHTTKVYSFIFNKCINENEKYFLGILNSPVLWFFLRSTGYILRGGYFTFKTEYLKPFPIKLINFNNKVQIEQHNEIVKMVDQLLQLKQEKPETKLQTKISQIESKIDYCENRINELVYQLYGLTEEEIRIIEKA